MKGLEGNRAGAPQVCVPQLSPGTVNPAISLEGTGPAGRFGGGRAGREGAWVLKAPLTHTARAVAEGGQDSGTYHPHAHTTTHVHKHPPTPFCFLSFKASHGCF